MGDQHDIDRHLRRHARAGRATVDLDGHHDTLPGALSGREVLRVYSAALIDRYAEMSATGALIFYSLFVMSANAKLAATIPLVIFGLYRYWYVVERLGGGESPTDAVLSDWPLALAIVIWVGVCVAVLLPNQ